MCVQAYARGDFDVTWSRLEDDMDENRKLRRLSAEAFRLYWIAIPWCRRHQTGGRLYLDDVKALCAKHRVRKLGSALQELLAVPYDFEIGCWTEVEPGLFEIHDFESYNPPTSTERVRKHRAAETSRNGSETFQGVSGNASSRARLRAGYPNPVPKPVITKNPPAESSSSLVPIEPERGDVFQLCSRMVELNEQRDAKARTITKGWRRQAKLLLDQDGRSLSEALSLLEWAAFDSFWGSNILSIPNFREHYDQLRLQRERAPMTVRNGRVDNHRAYDDRLAGLEHRLREEGA